MALKPHLVFQQLLYKEEFEGFRTVFRFTTRRVISTALEVGSLKNINHRLTIIIVQPYPVF